MKRKPPPPMALLQEHLEYVPDTGLFYWAKKPNRRIHCGALAGGINPVSGYVTIGIKKKVWAAHRLAWYICTGEWPETIDHINHVKDDNRLANLRAASIAENVQNSLGHLGVAYVLKRNKWQSQIRVNGRRLWLGYFSEREAAIRAYEAARRQYHKFAAD